MHPAEFKGALYVVDRPGIWHSIACLKFSKCGAGNLSGSGKLATLRPRDQLRARLGIDQA